MRSSRRHGASHEERAMAKRKKARKFTAEQKLRILEEAREPDTTVAEVLRRYQVDATTCYRWERKAKEGMREALEGRRALTPRPVARACGRPPTASRSRRDSMGRGLARTASILAQVGSARRRFA